MTILIINGPNLNMLGVREPEIYGHETLDDIKGQCSEKAQEIGLNLDFRQSNHEGEIVSWIQESLNKIDGIIINPAAYTHTSVAIHDALKLHNVPIIEVHLSNPEEREEFRHHSFVKSLATKTIAGRGVQGYIEALEALSQMVQGTIK